MHKETRRYSRPLSSLYVLKDLARDPRLARGIHEINLSLDSFNTDRHLGSPETQLFSNYFQHPPP